MKAIYVTRDTGTTLVKVWVASITKVEGCVAYADCNGASWTYRFLHLLGGCKRKYGDYPAEGEAWLVRGTKHYWMWTRVDNKMALLDTNGTAIAYKHRVKVMRLK